MRQLNEILEKVSQLLHPSLCMGVADNANLATFSHNSKSNRVDRFRV
jgi:hypothetical protein